MPVPSHNIVEIPEIRCYRILVFLSSFATLSYGFRIFCQLSRTGLSAL